MWPPRQANEKIVDVEVKPAEQAKKLAGVGESTN